MPGTAARPTYGESRTRREKAVDAAVLIRVKRGIALLEEEYGPSWVDKIDLNTLALSNGNQCVLGQVYGTYRVPAERLWGEHKPSRMFQARQHGFLDEPEAGASYEALERVWKKVLRPLVRRR